MIPANNKLWPRLTVGRVIRLVAAITLSVGALALLFAKTDVKLAKVSEKLLQVDLRYLLAALAGSVAFHILIGAHKWFLILRGMGCSTTFGETLLVRMGSDPIRIVAPFKTGELSNIAYFWRREKLSFAGACGWILFDKALNVAGTAFWLFLGLGWHLARRERLDAGDPRLVAAALGLIILGAMLWISPLVSNRVRRALYRLARFFGAKAATLAEQLLIAFERIPARRKIWLILYGILFQLRPLFVCYLLIMAYARDFAPLPSPAAILGLGSLVVIFGNIPYFQWGTGAREAALVALFAGYIRPGIAPAAVLVPIGLLMAAAIHFAPAFLGIPALGVFLHRLEEGRGDAAPAPNSADRSRENNPGGGDRE